MRGELIEVYKWMKGFNRGKVNKVLVVKEPGRTRSNGFKLDKFRLNNDLGRNWFTNRMVDEWNKLGSHVVGATVKKKLDTFSDSEERRG